MPTKERVAHDKGPKRSNTRTRSLDDNILVQAAGLKIKYTPHGASLDIFHDRSEEILSVGPKGTGKSLGLMQKVHLVLSKYPGARGFMSRKTRTSMTNSCIQDFNDRVLKPQDNVHFLKQDQQYNYPNKSMLAVIGLDDVNRLNSSEWDIGYIMEATETTENDWEICTACIRHGMVPYQQLLGDCNPDKPTHWLRVRCDKKLTKEYKSYHKDNPRWFNHSINEWTPEGIAYIKKLERLSGVRHRRLFLGEWAAAEGIVYEGYNAGVHLINRNELPAGWEEWPHYWSVDFGYKHPFVWQDWMEAPWGSLYLNREIYKTGMLVEDAAQMIRQLNAGFRMPHAIICDHDAEGRATLSRHLNMPTLAAYKMIQPGVQAVQARLQLDVKYENHAGIYFLRDSPVLIDAALKDAGSPVSCIEEIDGYVWDEKANEKSNSKKDEIPLDLDNHSMDAMRYVVAFIDNLADDPAEETSIITFDEDEGVFMGLY